MTGFPWSRPPPLVLALQGGGAHGAFTWGVLDALLEAGRFQLTAASGASAGALNAAVLAQGLMSGGADGGRAALETFWLAVADSLPAAPAVLSADGRPLQLTPWLQALLWWTRVLAPGDLNPTGADPLRRVIEKCIDFDALRQHSPLPLFVATTHAASGGLRLVREHELTADALLASACLPQFRHGVQLGGELHWDGGYAANPPLLPLLQHGRTRDVLLVLLMPRLSAPWPATAEAIAARVAELGFLTPFLAEWRTLVQLQAGAPRWWPALGAHSGWAAARWHVIDAGGDLAALPALSRMTPSHRFLLRLKAQGRARAQAWLAGPAHGVGRRTTADLAAWLR